MERLAIAALEQAVHAQPVQQGPCVLPASSSTGGGVRTSRWRHGRPSPAALATGAGSSLLSCSTTTVSCGPSAICCRSSRGRECTAMPSARRAWPSTYSGLAPRPVAAAGWSRLPARACAGRGSPAVRRAAPMHRAAATRTGADSCLPPVLLAQGIGHRIEIGAAGQAATVGGVLPHAHDAREQVTVAGLGHAPRRAQALRFGGTGWKRDTAALAHRAHAGAVQKGQRLPRPALVPEQAGLVATSGGSTTGNSTCSSTTGGAASALRRPLPRSHGSHSRAVSSSTSSRTPSSPTGPIRPAAPARRCRPCVLCVHRCCWCHAAAACLPSSLPRPVRSASSG